MDCCAAAGSRRGVDDAAVVSPISSFHDYQMLRINQVPPIQVHVIKSGEAPGRIGETGTTAAGPALRNATYSKHTLVLWDTLV